MLNMMDKMYFNATLKLKLLMNKVMYDENGDTNFISIIIVLGIVLALVVVFRGYITKILGKITSAVNNFNNDPFTGVAK